MQVILVNDIMQTVVMLYAHEKEKKLTDGFNHKKCNNEKDLNLTFQFKPIQFSELQ